MKKIFILLFLPLFVGCGVLSANLPFLRKRETRTGGVYKENLDENRIVDLIIVRKLSGKKKLWLFDDYVPYLEGYIRGIIVDYEDSPLEGIVVRVTDQGKDVPGFDPAVSDSNGVYRIRFSHPIKKKMVDVSGSISYNPPWEQRLDLLGAALEPQTKVTDFRLYYNQKLGIIGIGEDIPKTIAQKVTGSLEEHQEKKEKKKEKAEVKGKTFPPPPRSKPPQPKKSEDFFSGFGSFGN